MKVEEIFKDVAIIGAGPAGLFAVFQCGMMGMTSVVFDALADIGGQCTALYPEKPIYDIPTQPAITAEALIERLEEQAAPFKPVYITGHAVIGLLRIEGGWRVENANGTIAIVRAIIIAAGAGAFGPIKPPLDGLDIYEGKGVHYMVRRKEEFRGKKIVIAGGGDSAVDWALSLAPIAASVSLVHRRDKFRAAPESVYQLQKLAQMGGVRLIIPYQLSRINGSDGAIETVEVSNEEGNRLDIETDALLLFFGLSPDLGPIQQWNLALAEKQIVVDPHSCQTSQPGIYAIGDIASYKNKPKLILSGFHEAALAAHDIRHYLNPGQDFHQIHSTDKGLPQL